MTDFLLELRSEEIPARMQAGARSELEKLFRREMDAAGVAVGDLTVWSTPRRLALIARDLPLATEAVSEEAKGPPVGAPDAAVDGFCAKNGVTRDQLEARDVKGRQTWFAVIQKPGRATRDVLAAAIPAIVRDFAWPKSMRWGAASLSTESPRWVRPLSGIVAILGEDLVECEAGGVASGYATMGHRFHHSGEITIGSASDYQEKLRACHVIVDHEERQDMIRTGAAKVAADAGLTLVADEGLVIENAGLTEWPVPLLGRFDEAFLDVPPEVIQLTARVNQKYFVCESPSRLREGLGEGVSPSTDRTDPPPTPPASGRGDLANAFVCTSNIAAADGGAAIVDGNRKVLAARLSDARFFWEQDRKAKLEDHAKKLSRITFHEKLGTVADKVERVAKLARWLVESDIVTPDLIRGPAALASVEEKRDPGSGAGVTKEQLANLAEQAARLCKADLVTEMVGEFPELQGLMGGYYARAEGLPDAVADAIRDHYKPVGQGDDVPTAPVTVAVSLADKLDTLFGFFVIGETPTGSKDPYALRRAALGIIRLLQAHQVRLSVVAYAFEAYSSFSFDRDRRWFLYHVEDGKLGRDFYPVDRRLLEILDGADFWLFDAATDEDWFQVPYDDQQLEAYATAKFRSLAEVEHALLDFFADRLKVQQREAGVRHDLIDAVFALGGEDDLVRLLARVHALQAFMGSEDGANLLAGYKRAANILKKEGWQPPRDGEGDHAQHGGGDSADGAARGAGSPPSAAAPLPPPRAGEGGRSASVPRTGDEDPLENVDDPQMREVYAAAIAERANNPLSYTPEPAEKALIDALDAAEPQAAAAVEAEDFAGAMAALASLRGPIDRFFEEVTVNADEEIKRSSRLALLARFRAAVHKVADFSRIEG